MVLPATNLTTCYACATHPPCVMSQGEGEEEETDELVSQVLDEIGINTNAQVRERL